MNVRGDVGGLELCALWVGIKMVVTGEKEYGGSTERNQENHDQQCLFQGQSQENRKTQILKYFHISIHSSTNS